MAYKLKNTGSEIDIAIPYVLENLKVLFSTSEADNNKFLIVQNGEPTWVKLDEAEEVET